MRATTTDEAVAIERVSASPESGTAADTLLPHDAQKALARTRATTLIVLAIIGVTLVKQLVLVVAYPPFEGHDEVAHYGYIATLDREQRLPTLADNLPPETGPWSRFTLDWPAVYTANHPPLYYLLALPLYRLAPVDVESRLFALRLFSVPLFLLVIWLTYLLTLTLYPGERFLAVTAPALVAFQPQLSFEGAIVNNDVLAMLIGAAIVYLLAIALQRGLTAERSILLGTILGLGLLTKATLTAFVPLAIGVAAWCAYRHRRKPGSHRGWFQPWAVNIALISVPALILSLPWFIFLYAAYGDLTVFRSLDLLQSSWGAPSSGLLELLVSPDFHIERLHEGWGYFGWRLLPLGRFELWIVTFITGIAIAGLLLEGRRGWLRRKASAFTPDSAATIAMLVACCGIFYLAMVYFGTRVAFTQMRYVFPVAPAASVLAAIGIRALIPERWRLTGAAGIVTCAMLFQMLVLTRLVLPHGVV